MYKELKIDLIGIENHNYKHVNDRLKKHIENHNYNHVDGYIETDTENNNYNERVKSC